MEGARRRTPLKSELCQREVELLMENDVIELSKTT